MSIGEYLRGIRSRQAPSNLGLPDTGARRVSGLRREEVAVLAGISVDYYTRLEQGREKNPSAQIIEALARGLDLTGHEREHLFRLAGYQAPVGGIQTQVRPELARLLSRWQNQAAFVLTGTLDILAPNALTRALFSGFIRQDNLARMVFSDPAARTFYIDWDQAADNVVAALRHNSTSQPAAVFDAFIHEMCQASGDFRELWSMQQVRGKTHAVKRFHHHEIGDLSLAYQALGVPGTEGWQVIVYDAEPGTAAAEAFTLLRLSRESNNDKPWPAVKGGPDASCD
ncbi:helix-turn-helix protein [Tamaricihabitans halophyticus]|uniref:Helix-turn-helix protein n=1 Tax=Tamaricihabitans halophyticus TaxID=1262583 RepID=A0A4R2PUS7_9PSEU|nr:helix-turn-helix transcriptional regulator [Tamaricihabitans halophyticus]TCP38954.1 helix-turn-helix protein [Tamaricihabitans halophyticus]